VLALRAFSSEPRGCSPQTDLKTSFKLDSRTARCRRSPLDEGSGWGAGAGGRDDDQGAALAKGDRRSDRGGLLEVSREHRPRIQHWGVFSRSPESSHAPEINTGAPKPSLRAFSAAPGPPEHCELAPSGGNQQGEGATSRSPVFLSASGSKGPAAGSADPLTTSRSIRRLSVDSPHGSSKPCLTNLPTLLATDPSTPDYHELGSAGRPPLPDPWSGHYRGHAAPSESCHFVGRRCRDSVAPLACVPAHSAYFAAFSSSFPPAPPLDWVSCGRLLLRRLRADDCLLPPVLAGRHRVQL
jgi:hypothetical protein